MVVCGVMVGVVTTISASLYPLPLSSLVRLSLGVDQQRKHANGFMSFNYLVTLDRQIQYTHTFGPLVLWKYSATHSFYNHIVL